METHELNKRQPMTAGEVNLADVFKRLADSPESHTELKLEKFHRDTISQKEIADLLLINDFEVEALSIHGFLGKPDNDGMYSTDKLRATIRQQVVKE